VEFYFIREKDLVIDTLEIKFIDNNSREHRIMAIVSSTTEDKNLTRTNTASMPSTQFTPIQMGMGLIILGASAGLTLYTKKTGSMLKQMDKLNKAHVTRVQASRKPGPMTKHQHEKTKKRWEEDDLI